MQFADIRDGKQFETLAPKHVKELRSNYDQRMKRVSLSVHTTRIMIETCLL